MRAADSPLRLATRELHHAAEAHPVGASMADGTMRPEWWTDWLYALGVIHAPLDARIHFALDRGQHLSWDLDAMIRQGYEPHESEAAAALARDLAQGRGIGGAAYVFTGAHLMGGAITERAIGLRLPCAHLRWSDRPAALAAWQHYRTDATLEADARRAFATVIAILDEILARHPAAAAE